MATQLQFRRGTTAENNSFTGAAGEISIDTSTKSGILVHDGSTAGGFEIMPSGAIIAFGGAAAPDAGWLLCDGSNVSRTTYARLFAAIATAYGAGDGSSTFGLPDLRDRTTLGKGSNNSTLGTETGSAAASSVIQTASANTGTSNTGTGTTGTANTGTSNTGTGTTGAGNTGTGTTAAGNTGTGTTGTGNTGSEGGGDLTVGTRNFAISAKDSSTAAGVNSVNQAAHTHSVPGLSIPALSVAGLGIPALSVAGLSIPALTVPALTVPGLSIPALTVPALTIPALSATLPTSVVNFIIKT